jgi:DNA-directed RNA polymerase subunit RPC12/RpoP
MKILLGLLLFLALVVVRLVLGDDDPAAVRRCPSCGLKDLYPRFGRKLDRPEYFQCAKCGARYRIDIHGRMVKA